MMFRKLTTTLMAALAFAASMSVLEARQRRDVPDVTLVTLDGTPVRSTTLAQEAHWLLVYVEPNCGACSNVLGAMRREENPGMAERVTVIVGRATLDQARAIAAASTELSAARWLVDADGSARQALAVKSAPVTSGIRKDTIEWTFMGALRQSAEMTSMLVSWLRQG